MKYRTRASLERELATLRKNLNTLEEQRAKYGMEAPLRVLNAIDDHRQAIKLVEAALRGELDTATLEDELRIINISQAGTVVVSPPERRGMRLWAGLAALAIVIVGLILGALSLGGNWQPATPTPFPPPRSESISEFDGMFVSAIAQNPKSGDLWISVFTDKMPGGVYRYTRGEGLAFFGQKQEGSGPQADVLSILGRMNGEVWLGTDGAGVTALLAGAETPSADDDRWRTYTIADGLIGSQVLAMAEDQQGNVWFGTFDGLGRLTPQGEWLYYHPQTGWIRDLQALPEEDRPVAYAICVDEVSGDVWVATSEALLRWPASDLEGQPVRYSRENALSDKEKMGAGSFISLTFDQEGRPWVGTTKGFVSVLEAGVKTHDRGDDRWQTYAVAPEVDTALVLALLPLPDGRVLAGTTGGGLRIYVPGPDPWTGYTEAGRDVTALFLEEDERVWIGTGQGLRLWDLQPMP